MPAMRDRSRVLVAGGGVAALECMLALQALAPDAVSVELLAPERHFTYRPLAVVEPFGRHAVRRFPLATIAADRGVTLHRDALARVHPDDNLVETQGGVELAYDALVLAVGARPVEAVRGAITFRGPQDVGRVTAVLAGLLEGTISRVAFVVPGGATWTLPLYELALQTGAAIQRAQVRAQLTVITPERAPLAAFGREASEAVCGLLAERGVLVRTGSLAEACERGRLWMELEGSFAVDAAIALPRLVGPHLRGVPSDSMGFVPVDDVFRAEWLDNVYAVGDVAAHGIKQGGLAAQQAETAARAIAASAGAAVPPEPYAPVLRGLLLTGGRPLRLRRDETGCSEVADDALWWPANKIAGRHLAPYLASHPAFAAELAPST